MRHSIVTLAACSALGTLLAAGTPAAPPATDVRAALHVLNRITWGPRPGDLERVQRMGVERFIDQQLHPDMLDDGGLERRLERFETLQLTSRDIAVQFAIPALEARRARQAQGGDTVPGAGAAPQAANGPERLRPHLPLVELADAKIVRAVYSERQLHEVLADFWFNHFNVDATKGTTRFLLTEYEREAIRPYVLGRFRDLLGATAKSPAMLFYLDNWMSVDPNGPHLEQMRPAARRLPNRRQRQAGQSDAPPARRPSGLNENYGRELLELHTLGVDGGYSQHDVTEVTRAFTGWSIELPRQGGGFRFAAALHDNGQKMVLGHRLAAGGGIRDGEQVLDILAAHPATARFISTKLARRFVSDTPPAALVDRMTGTFTKTSGDLRAVMTVLLTSSEFLSPAAEPSKVKTPLEFVVSALRATGAEIRDGKTLVRSLEQLGMPLYQCQPPTGYADTAEAWVNTGALVQRMNLALSLASGEVRGVRLTSPPKADALLQGSVSETTRATIAKAKAQSERQALALALGAPEFQRR
ncbi:MAG: DUF1800 domain-containing protein [Vicinamibacterales bacterium]